MFRKFHLQAYRNIPGFSACRNGSGNVPVNTTDAVQFKEFAMQDSNLVCKKCAAIYLKRRNQQRKIKGLALVKTAFESFQA